MRAEVAEAGQRGAPGVGRVHPGVDQLAGAHLEVEGEFFVDLLIDRDPPQPRAQGAPHDANSTFDTPAEKRFQVASSASSWVRPAGVRR